MIKKFNIMMVFIAVLIGLSAYAAGPCPSEDSIRYDKAQGRFVSKESPGWQSTDMAALDSVPSGILRSAIAMGERLDAAIICTYDLGKNSVSLYGEKQVELGTGWTLVKDNFYYCADIKTCVYTTRH